MYHMCAVLVEARKGHWILQNWSCAWLWAMWVLGTKPDSSARATSAPRLSYSPGSQAIFFFFLEIMAETGEMAQ